MVIIISYDIITFRDETCSMLLKEPKCSYINLGGTPIIISHLYKFSKKNLQNYKK